jgi:hypothetical protein
VPDITGDQGRIVPSITSLDKQLTARGMMLQVKQERFRNWGSSKAQDDFRRKLLDNLCLTEKCIITIEDTASMVWSAPDLGEGISQERKVQLLG